MRAVLMTAVGGPDVLMVAELVDERYLARKPERLAFVQAAAAPLVTITAWEALRERARVSAGGADVVHDTVGGKRQRQILEQALMTCDGLG
jgi:D-arabinose 1-dehydrogenase-like Zn-dependent alcohol dehydrogenase